MMQIRRLSTGSLHAREIDQLVELLIDAVSKQRYCSSLRSRRGSSERCSCSSRRDRTRRIVERSLDCSCIRRRAIAEWAPRSWPRSRPKHDHSASRCWFSIPDPAIDRSACTSGSATPSPAWCPAKHVEPAANSKRRRSCTSSSRVRDSRTRPKPKSARRPLLQPLAIAAESIALSTKPSQKRCLSRPL